MSRPNAIQKLPPHVIGKIAAGEVIERPASVVKELLENALDAGARQVSIEIGSGGLDLIRVSDDGCGIAPDDLPLAFERHATSKLLDATTTSKPCPRSASAAKRCPASPPSPTSRCVSRPADAAGGRFVASAKDRSRTAARRALPAGTVVAVRGLFARQPARLKFLRSPAAEAAQIAGVVSHYALAYPEVRFTLLSRRPPHPAHARQRRPPRRRGRRLRPPGRAVAPAARRADASRAVPTRLRPRPDRGAGPVQG